MDGQSSRAQIPRLDRAAMDCDCAGRDRESQAVTTDRAVACRIDPVERLEYELEILLRHTRAAVADDHFDAPLAALRFDPDFRTRRSVAQRVANHVFQRTAQQLRVAIDRQRPLGLQSNTAAVRLRFNTNVRHNVGQQRGDVQRRALQALHGALETSELQSARYELLEAIRFAG